MEESNVVRDREPLPLLGSTPGRDVPGVPFRPEAAGPVDLVGSAAFDIDGKTYDVSVSIGVADLTMLREPGAKALVEASDAALYVAKRNGRARVEIFDPESEPTRLV